MNEQEIALSYSQPTTEQHKLKGGSGQAWGAAGGMEQGGGGRGGGDARGGGVLSFSLFLSSLLLRAVFVIAFRTHAMKR